LYSVQLAVVGGESLWRNLRGMHVILRTVIAARTWAAPSSVSNERNE
jgi:hypothetical protein